jgi:hypothetical protein
VTRVPGRRAARTHRAADRRSRAAALAAGAVALAVLVAGTAATHAAFTDTATAALDPVGGAYDLALVGPDGGLVPGDPDPLVVEQVVTLPDGSTAVEVDVVTTTTATGPVTLTVRNGRTAALPPDPGMSGAGADPYDVGLFTVTVDDQVLLAGVPAAQLAPVTVAGWETEVPRTVRLSVTLPAALGNPYYYGRAMVVALEIDGSTS